MPETLLSGIQSGLRYARHSPPLRALIVRNLSFCFCASALWALLPVIARDQLGLGAGGYGLLIGGLRRRRHRRRAVDPAAMQPHARSIRIVTSGVVLWAVAATLVAVTELHALALVGAVPPPARRG